MQTHIAVTYLLSPLVSLKCPRNLAFISAIHSYEEKFPTTEAENC